MCACCCRMNVAFGNPPLSTKMQCSRSAAHRKRRVEDGERNKGTDNEARLLEPMKHSEWLVSDLFGFRRKSLRTTTLPGP